MSKQSPNFRSNPAWLQGESLSEQTCQPVSQTWRLSWWNALCKTCERHQVTREWGGYRGGSESQPFKMVQRSSLEIQDSKSCSVVAKVDREYLPLNTDLDTRHGAFWKYVTLEMRETSRCQKWRQNEWGEHRITAWVWAADGGFRYECRLRVRVWGFNAPMGTGCLGPWCGHVLKLLLLLFSS